MTQTELAKLLDTDRQNISQRTKSNSRTTRLITKIVLAMNEADIVKTAEYVISKDDLEKKGK